MIRIWLAWDLFRFASVTCGRPKSIYNLLSPERPLVQMRRDLDTAAGSAAPFMIRVDEKHLSPLGTDWNRRVVDVKRASPRNIK